MNLFRSEEHARNWSSYDPATVDNLQPLADYLDRFSAERFRERDRRDYISWVSAQQ